MEFPYILQHDSMERPWVYIEFPWGFYCAKQECITIGFTQHCKNHVLFYNNSGVSRGMTHGTSMQYFIVVHGISMVNPKCIHGNYMDYSSIVHFHTSVRWYCYRMIVCPIK